ncbi:MAG TPA: hypothetical protein VHR18_10435 [Solirubrobacterales bacterium]|nr:hypothetical protein [Solirubrobacterales bacterium]
MGALVLAIAVSLGGIASAETSTVGNLKLTVDGGFTPKALPKSTLAPIALTAEGKIETLDGTHPPALKEFLLETDKNGAVDVKGYPVCTSGKLQAQTTDAARAICPKAIVGSGKTTLEVLLNESRAVPVSSALTVFNGGFKGGTTTLYIHAYITVPIPSAIVTTVKIKKINKGRYGLLSTASVPVIAGGAGSVETFSLKIDKKFTYKGKRVSVLSAKCPDGKLQAHGTAVFRDGTRLSADFVRSCTSKG